MRSAFEAPDQLAMTDMQNMLVDHHLEMLKTGSPSTTFGDIRAMWEQQLDHTRYYRMLLRSCVGSFMESPLTQNELGEQAANLAIFPRAVQDVLALVKKWNTKRRVKVWKIDGCRYHVHPDGKRCQVTSTKAVAATR